MKFEKDINQLEALRGLAALMVVFHHSIVFGSFLDPNYNLQKYLTYGFPGHFAVLVFFTLSGYVIGVNYQQRLSDSTSIFSYLKKRLIRLYPIYLVSIVLAYLCFKSSMVDVIGQVLFLQGGLVAVMQGNAPLWSIHFEVVYYLLFIIISYFTLDPSKVLIVGLFIIVAINKILPYQLLTEYYVGFSFWILGLIIAWSTKKNIAINSINLNKQISLIFLFFCLIYNPLGGTLLKLTEGIIPTQLSSLLKVSDLILLPICVYFILVFANRTFRFMAYLRIYAYLFPLVSLAIVIFLGFKEISMADLMSYAIVIICYLLSIAVLFINSNGLYNLISTKLAWLGTISYALYLLHHPVMQFLNKIHFFSGSLLTYGIRVLILFTILIPLSYVLERIIQPKIKTYFNK